MYWAGQSHCCCFVWYLLTKVCLFQWFAFFLVKQDGPWRLIADWPPCPVVCYLTSIALNYLISYLPPYPAISVISLQLHWILLLVCSVPHFCTLCCISLLPVCVLHCSSQPPSNSTDRRGIIYSYSSKDCATALDRELCWTKKVIVFVPSSTEHVVHVHQMTAVVYFMLCQPLVPALS